ncbi:MAG TPA: NAD(P)-dependent oxidoreductase [Archangium sp.]|uniref:NAD(P)-dependent oxidoreductase n=1 Tax=Archangium sp. TaxID=1872627 RepID=UPI002E305353|nr:NAD(P)-dependent oxidoreductase [Archangium sp.]HEX5753333.1 NAD(P)-dependent oxidoreductase [Archangium sp.]
MERPTRPRVFVTRQLPGDALARLAAQVSLRVWEEQLPPPRDVLLSEAREVDGLITLLTDRVDEPLLDGAHRLRAVSNVAVGYDNIDVAACTARRIPVGHLGGAALDVTDPEPLPSDSPLMTLPNVLLAPHIASASHATRGRMASMAVDNLLAALEGRKPPHCVNPELFP